MKGTLIKWTGGVVAILAVLLLWPLAVQLFCTPAGKEGWYFTLFLAVDPVFVGVLGLFAGCDLKRRWPLPLLAALSMPPLFWLTVRSVEGEMMVYPAIYLGIALVCMLIGEVFMSHKEKTE